MTKYSESFWKPHVNSMVTLCCHPPPKRTYTEDEKNELPLDAVVQASNGGSDPHRNGTVRPVTMGHLFV